MGIDALNAYAAAQFDIAVGDQITGAHIDVITRATTQVLQEQTRVVVTKIEHKTRVFQLLIELGVALFDCLKRRALKVRQHLVGNRGKNQISLVVG